MGITPSAKLIDEISKLYIERLSKHTHLFKDTVALLEYLFSKYKLHIITNGFENVQQRKLQNSGIARFFDVVLTAEKAGCKKPHPTIFITALEEAKVLPENALMIGDSLEADIQGALKLGMQAIHFNSHSEDLHQECLIVNELAVLMDIL